MVKEQITKQNETPRLIAERLARNFNSAFRGSYVPSAYRDATTAIEVALNAERERALSDAALQECVFCAGAEGYNPLPVKATAGYVHRNDPPHGLAGVYCKAPRIRALITATQDSR